MDPHELRRTAAAHTRRDRARRAADERVTRAIAAADSAAAATDGAAEDALDLAIGLGGPVFASSAAHAAAKLARHLAAAAEQFHAMADAYRDIHAADLRTRIGDLPAEYLRDVLGDDGADLDLDHRGLRPRSGDIRTSPDDQLHNRGAGHLIDHATEEFNRLTVTRTGDPSPAEAAAPREPAGAPDPHCVASPDAAPIRPAARTEPPSPCACGRPTDPDWGHHPLGCLYEAHLPRNHR
jgi:hypothetical protein